MSAHNNCLSDQRIIRIAACAVIFGVALLFAGCSSSSPRFRTGSGQTAKAEEDADEFRFASKIRDEETREDDRKVDVKSFERKYVPASPSSANNAIPPAGLNRDRVLLDVVSYLGVPYAYGGISRKGIDCSGFTARIYESAAGRLLPRSTADQYRTGSNVSRAELRFGDLVFFNTTGEGPSHVGIYIEDDIFAHASVSYGVTLSSLQSSYYRERFFGARRLVR